MKVFKKKRKSVQVTRTEALKSTPVKNIQVRETRLETGEVLLSYPVEIRPWIASLIRRFGGTSEKTQTKKLQLDALGTEVWDLIDGRRSVQQVIQEFAKEHRLYPKEAEIAVTRFLRELGNRGLIGLG